ncbi:MAG: 16S rRNA (uracil(1498)-N(3))-methyltransferase [Candidatus Pacebacteria bacterium]|nr:16S rRNA (uracil(1498)-N(3))-methyltransferase [Candidatus Paceibacterota bacterium]
MIFNYDLNAGKEKIEIKENAFIHLFKSRRTKLHEIINFSNLKDNLIYQYKITKISKHKAEAKLIEKKKNKNTKTQKLHIGWCFIDPKDIKTTLPFLNQIGISEITFISSDRSQKNYKINPEKIEKVLINSSQQCGRFNLMKINTCKNIKDFIKQNPESYILDFDGIKNQNKKNIKTIIVGPEGGFSKEEKNLFKKEKIVSFNTPHVLKSENAIISIASNILL